jgi:hypothetical protein
MARTPKIRRWPQALRDTLDELVRAGRTIEEILATLQSIGAPDVSRATVGRWKQRAEQNFARYREAQEVAGAWVTKLGAEPGSDVGRLLQEILKTLAFQTMSDMGDGEKSVEARDLMFLAKALRDLSGAQKTSVDTEAQLRKAADIEMQKRTAAAADVAVKEAKKAGLSAETTEQMRNILLNGIS